MNKSQTLLYEKHNYIYIYTEREIEKQAYKQINVN